MPLNDKPTTDDKPDHSTENGVGELKDNDKPDTDKPSHVAQDAQAPGNDLPEQRPEEHGGQSGLEPTRYGDWEKKGRCTDF